MNKRTLSVLDGRFWRAASWLIIPAWIIIHTGAKRAVTPPTAEEINRQFFKAALAFKPDQQEQGRWLRMGADINWRNPEWQSRTALSALIGDCSLTRASTDGRVADDDFCRPQAEFLLDHGADPNVQDGYRNTALDLAVCLQDTVAVDLLKQHGAMKQPGRHIRAMMAH